MHPCNNLELLPVVRIHAVAVVDEAAAAAAVPRLAVRAEDAVLGEDVVVVVVAGGSEGGRVVEEQEPAARLQALFYRVHHGCERQKELGVSFGLW